MSLSSSSRGGRRQSVDSFSDRSFQTAYQDLDLISHEARRGSLPSLPDSEDLQERSVPPARRPRGFFHFFESAHTNNPFRSLSVCANPRTRSLESEPRSLSQNNSPRKQNPVSRIFFPEEQVQTTEEETPTHEPVSAEYSSLTRTLGGILECIVCSNILRPPIFHCLNGHDICKNCRSQVVTCPLCRTGYSGGRNFFAEELIVNLFCVCKYQNQGCNEIMMESQVAEHEASCVYGVCECRFFRSDDGACDWRGLKVELVDHVKQAHEIYICELNVIPMMLMPVCDQLQHCYLKLNHGEMFWWHYKKNPSVGVFETLQYIGPPEKARNFKFCITYADPLKVLSVQFSDLTCTLDDDFQNLCDQKKCLFIPIETYNRMCVNGEINFKLKIVKLRE